jgi:FkbH-like protein
MFNLKETLNRVSTEDIASIIAALEDVEQAGVSFSSSVGVGFLRNFTIENIEPFLKFHCYSNGIKPEISFGGYNTIQQELLDKHSHIYQLCPEIIVLSLMLESLDQNYGAVNWSSSQAISNLREILELISANTKSTVLLNNFYPPFYSELGIMNAVNIFNAKDQVLKINTFLREYVNQHSSQFYLIDWERLISRLGEEAGIDYRYWYLSKAPFKLGFLNAYAMEITKVIKAIKGKTKKCLVLDCDGTLWGGIIGEDGLALIKLDKNAFPGNVFYEFQRSLLGLFGRGILLALCSKNNEGDVFEVIDKHEHCLLKREHLCAWRINWDNKADNLSSLANELNIGLDSMVFIDDDPAECDLVGKLLPEITVLQVPKKLYEYPPLLFKSGLFDTLSINEEDKERTLMYQVQQKRRSETNKFKDINQYLSSLRLVAHIHEAGKQEIPRVAQLTQKTNQFNLTTRRYSEVEIESFINGSASSVFTLSVEDKFGDLGLTGVLVAKKVDQIGVIDSILLSCRILGRKLEHCFARYCMEKLEKKWDIGHWKAEYIATKKNLQTVNFWEDLGFKCVKNSANNKSYQLAANRKKTEKFDFIKIIA